MAAFTIPGDPVPKARPRVVNRNTYTDKRTTEAEQIVMAYARKARVRRLDGPVRLMLGFYRATTQPADIDNLCKLVQDALNGIAYVDDQQIVWLSATKAIDPARPRTEVVVEEWRP